MISLKSYFNANNSEEAPLRRVIALLISRMGTSAVQCDLEEFEAFTTDIKRINVALVPDLTPDNLLVHAETAAEGLTAYNKRIGRLLESQRSEVTNIMGMLQDTVVNIAGENTRSGRRLQEITLELEQSGPMTDLRVLKGRLAECLTGLREEMSLQKAEAAVTMENLQVTIARGRESIVALGGNRPGSAERSRNNGIAIPGANLDTVTGLPCRDAALVAMQSAIGSGTRHYAVVMVINRVQMIKDRFGHKVGDHMIAGFKDEMAKQLPGPDQLFRWTGPAFVAILERADPIDVVRVEVRRILDTKIEVSYSGTGRSVLIPISAVWLALPIISVADTDKQIQAFTASQNS
jgi:diguanylate cyclase (GGDEF)-like protein